jgi:hypothetical protein
MGTRIRTLAAGRSALAGLPPRRAGVSIGALAVIGAAALSGCSSAPAATAGATVSPAAASSPTTAATASTPPAGPPGTTPSQPASAPPAPPVTLGQLAGVFAHGSGFGQAEPVKIFNGGDPTGLVTNIVWQSWGSARAIGTGTSEYVGPSQSVATGTAQAVTVVAFRLGTCDGKRMYRAVEWYFPQRGQSFDPGRYENICTGSYVPNS